VGAVWVAALVPAQVPAEIFGNPAGLLARRVVLMGAVVQAWQTDPRHQCPAAPQQAGPFSRP